MASLFRKAERKEVLLRMQIYGISGSGKTYTGLAVARGMAGTDLRIAVIDSERGSSALYGDKFPFDVLQVEDVPVGDIGRKVGRFDPAKYGAAIDMAVAEGYGVILVDSLTHAWAGEGGVQDIVEAAARAKFGGNSYMAWSVGTDVWNRLLSKVINAKAHMVVTSRAKAEFVETEERGRKAYKQVGTKAIQRGETKYEFDIVGQMDQEHYLSIEKTRFSQIDGAVIQRPGPDFGRDLRLLLTGEAAPTYDPIAYERQLREAAGIDLPTAAAFCVWCERPAPSAMSEPERQKLLAYLGTEKGQAHFRRFADRRPRRAHRSEVARGRPARAGGRGAAAGGRAPVGGRARGGGAARGEARRRGLVCPRAVSVGRWAAHVGELASGRARD